MADPVSIFSRGQPAIIGVDVDLRSGEFHGSDADVTMIPIEDGSVISDHIILLPDEVEISAEIGNFDGNDSKSLGERAKTAWQELKRLKNARGVYELLTQHELYTDMAIVHLGAEHVAPYKGRLILRCGFRKVNRTQLTVVAISESELSADVQKAASSEVEGGRVPPLTEDDAPARTSLAKSFLALFD